MKTFNAADGRSYATIADSNPDPSRRFSIRISEPMFIGAKDMRALAAFLLATANEYDPKSAKKSAAPAEGQPAAKPTEGSNG
jgi:hypothetical protein